MAGVCSSCTSDAQCGALSCCDDDGAGPQPGRCKPFCAITQTYSNLATFNQGTYNGTSASGSPLNPACVGALCWAGEDVVISVPYLWVPNTGDGKISRYNVTTGAEEGIYNTSVVSNWPGGSGTATGCSISRTSVNPFDATVWIADRCGPGGGGVAHLAYDGTMLCYARVSGGPRGMATDAEGNAWVASWTEGTMRKFSGTEFEPGNASPKRCKLLQTVVVPGPGGWGGFAYGAAADNNNWIWLQQNTNVVAINANTGAVMKNYPTTGCVGYGITVDQEYVWLGCYSSSNVARVRKSDGAVDLAATGGNPRGIATSTDGFVYAAGWNNQIYKINRNTMAFTAITVPALSNIISAAVDSSNRVWAVSYQGPLVRIEPNGAQTVFGSGNRSQYVYTDLTGQQTINAGLTPGLWSIINDANYPTPQWTRLNFTTIKPPNTTVSARVKVATSVAALTTTPWWNGLLLESTYRLETNGQVLLNDIGLPAARFIQVEVKLTTTSSTVTPVVQSVSATWAP